jgi:hypothetical protein
MRKEWKKLKKKKHTKKLPNKNNMSTSHPHKKKKKKKKISMKLQPFILTPKGNICKLRAVDIR